MLVLSLGHCWVPVKRSQTEDVGVPIYLCIYLYNIIIFNSAVLPLNFFIAMSAHFGFARACCRFGQPTTHSKLYDSILVCNALDLFLFNRQHTFSQYIATYVWNFLCCEMYQTFFESVCTCSFTLNTGIHVIGSYIKKISFKQTAVVRRTLYYGIRYFRRIMHKLYAN